MKGTPAAMDRDILLRVKDLNKYFGGNHAVDNVSFELRRGEVLGLIGDNGAGKSTLIKMISGVHAPTSGSIYWQGREIEAASPRKVRELGIETIYQDLSLAENLGVASNLFLGREIARKLLGIIEILDDRKMEEESRKLLDRLRIEIPDFRTTVRDLSGGQRQSVAIGRAVFWQAQLLIMDEPTAALGVKERSNVLDLIKLLKERDVSVILISHNLTDIFEVTDRLLVMRRGVKVGELDTAKTNEGEVVHLMIGTAD